MAIGFCAAPDEEVVRLLSADESTSYFIVPRRSRTTSKRVERKVQYSHRGGVIGNEYYRPAFSYAICMITFVLMPI